MLLLHLESIQRSERGRNVSSIRLRKLSTARDTSRHNYSSEYPLRSVDTPTELNIERGKVGGNATPHCAGPAVGEQPAAPFPARLFLVGWLGKRGATHLLPKLFCPRAREKFSPPYYCSVARENLVIRSFHCVSPPPPLRRADENRRRRISAKQRLRQVSGQSGRRSVKRGRPPFGAGDGGIWREGKWLDQRNIECRSISIRALCPSLSLSLYLSIYLSLSHSLHDCPITGRENISSKRSFVLGWAGKFLRYGFLCGARVFRQLRVSRKKKLLDL